MTAERRHDHRTRGIVEHALGRQRRALKRYELSRILVLVVLVFSVWAVSYKGRQELTTSTRAACERGKLDRRANAKGWRSAEAARRQTAADGTKATGERQAAATAADAYADIARGLESRARIDCKAAFPDAKLLPF